MIEVPLYPNGYPCKCSGKCNYSKAYEAAGKPKYIDFDKFTGKNFSPISDEDILIYNYIKIEYCLKK
tara:strand:- start:209 stop:409 length:201 start_codon:yes stop_codon:yes gene_type:complete